MIWAFPLRAGEFRASLDARSCGLLHTVRIPNAGSEQPKEVPVKRVLIVSRRQGPLLAWGEALLLSLRERLHLDLP